MQVDGAMRGADDLAYVSCFDAIVVPVDAVLAPWGSYPDPSTFAYYHNATRYSLYTSLSTCLHVDPHVHIHVYTYVYTHVYTHVHTHVYTHV